MAATTIREDGGNDLSRYLDALSIARRRYALYYLQENTVGTVSELTEYVLQCETDRPISEISEEDQ